MSPTNLVRRWWHLLKYSPGDSQYYVKKLPKVVAIGGGTGLSSLLRGLKNRTPNITAIVAVTDNGKSSGFLRKNFETLPPGDIRQCIAALAPDEELLTKLMKYRFNKGRGLTGHAFGNLLMVALTEIEGGFDRSIISLSRLLKISGTVLPATLEKVNLIGTMKSGLEVEGEVEITKIGHKDPIKSVRLSAAAKSYKPAISAINEADIIIIGPGSLYTSVIPPLLLTGVCRAVKNSAAIKIYVCNASTERGETEGYSVSDHLVALQDVLGYEVLNIAMVNHHKIRVPKIPEGKLGAINQVITKSEALAGVRIKACDLINRKNPLHHDSEKLATELINAYNEYIR